MSKKKIPPKPPDLTRKKPMYKTIKTSLKSIIKDEKILGKINDLVIKCNSIVIDVYQFIRLYCLHIYHNKKEIPKLNSKFISYCIKALGKRDNRGKKSTNNELLNELQNFYANEYQPIFNHQKYDLTGLSFTVPYMCMTVETCLTNNLKEHFIKRLLRFINIFADEYYESKHGKDKEHNEEYHKNKKKLLWNLKKSILNNVHNEIPIEFKYWFIKYKNKIVPKEFKKSIAYDCHANPFKYIKYSFFMNEMYEKRNIKTRKLIERKKKVIDEDILDKYHKLKKEISSLKKNLLNINKKDKNYIMLLNRFINLFANKHLDKQNKDDKNKYKNRKQIIKKLKKSIHDNKYKSIPIELKEWFNKYKKIILPNKIKGKLKKDYKSNKYKYDKYATNILSAFEKVNKNINNKIKKNNDKLDKIKNNTNIEEISKELKELNSQIIKLFQPLSLRKTCIPKYVTLDTATLINLFSERGEKGVLLQALKKKQKLVWEKYIRINKRIFKQTKGYVFNYTIQTDGIGCSLLFCHNTLANKKYGGSVKKIVNDFYYIDDLFDEQINDLKNKKLVSIDPGKRNLVYMCDDQRNKLRYTCSQRDTESLAKRNRRIIYTNKTKNKIIELETQLSGYCSKTVDYNKFKQYIKAKHAVNEQVKTFYQNELYRKLNWRTKTYRQRSEDRFVNRIEKTFGNKDNLVLVWGDWSRRSQMAGLTPTMNIGLRKIVAKKYLTLSINEFNTSKKCCKCWKDLEYKAINGNKKFRLLVCKNCNGKNTGSSESENNSVFSPNNSFFTRDVNSCVNMLNIAKHMINNNKERPKAFCRIDNKKNKTKSKGQANKKLPSPLKEEKVGTSVVFTGR